MKISGIVNPSLVNGEGCRYTIFMQGCDIEPCPGCHSPHTWDISKGITVEVDDIIEDIENNTQFIDGVSISGGNPTMQFEELLDLCKKIKDRGLNIWLWSGHDYNYINEYYTPILNYIDVLIDGKYDKNKPTTKPYRGSDNQRMWVCKNGVWKIID